MKESCREVLWRGVVGAAEERRGEASKSSVGEKWCGEVLW